jgi:hypothetical protein
MTSKHLDGHTHPSKINEHTRREEDSFTVYVLMAICYLLIALTLYMIWQKASMG